MELLRGVVRGFDPMAYRATVQVAGSLSVWLEGVRVARSIPAAEVVAGRRCLLALPEEANPAEGVVIAVYE